MMDYLSGKYLNAAEKKPGTRQRLGMTKGSALAWQQAVVKAGSKHCHGFGKAIGSKDT
jgi:hypothetical protein